MEAEASGKNLISRSQTDHLKNPSTHQERLIRSGRADEPSTSSSEGSSGNIEKFIDGDQKCPVSRQNPSDSNGPEQIDDHTPIKRVDISNDDNNNNNSESDSNKNFSNSGEKVIGRLSISTSESLLVEPSVKKQIELNVPSQVHAQTSSGSSRIFCDNRTTGPRLIKRRRRSHLRRSTADKATAIANNYSDSDRDGDVDYSDEDDNVDWNRSDNNDLNTSSDDNARRLIIVNNLSSRWRQQDKPVFVRLRMPRNKQQEVKGHHRDYFTTANHSHPSDATQLGITCNGDNQRHQQPKKFNQKSSQSNIAQCRETYSIIERAFFFLKRQLSSLPTSKSCAPGQDQNRLDSSPSGDSDKTTTTTDIQFHDKRTHEQDHQLPWTMPNKSYQPVPGQDEFRRARRKSSRPREFQRLGGPGGYSKLNHHYYRISSKNTNRQEIKRLILLLVIILVCCYSLWKLYQVLTEDYNYLGVFETPSILGKYEHYAVSTDAKPCAKVGSALLARGGSAVDAAIGTLLCMGVVIPNSLGLGGGCLMTIYDRSKKQAIVIDGREVAPDYATENMFANDSLKASRGPLSIAIPGEVAAYWKAHQLYGKLNWSELFDDSIEMAEKGVPTVEHLAFGLRAKQHARYITPPLAKIFLNNKTGEYYDEGELIIQKELANTLRRIRDHGVKEFYGGETGRLFVDDLKAQGGKITLDDLSKYEAIVKEPLVFELAADLNLYTQPTPGSGIVLSVILRIMKELGYYKDVDPRVSFDSASLFYHRLAEAYKYAYAQRAGLEDMPDDPLRMEQLIAKLKSDEFIKQAVSKITNVTHNDDRYGGTEFFQEDHGTAHVSTLDMDGNAASVTSSVNLYFGSGLISPSTGIIYNDVMDDFVSPNLVNKFGLAPSKFNHIKPGRRPISSMAPSVFTDSNGDVKLIIGASGGAKITTAIAYASIRICFVGDDLKKAIDGPRIHHQYLPNDIWYELNFPKNLLHSLADRGHTLKPILDRSSVIMAIASEQLNKTSRYITANSDYRKGGSVDGL